MKDELTFGQCEYRSAQMRARILDKLGIECDVMMWKSGDVTITLTEPDREKEIVDLFFQFWSLTWRHSQGKKPILMFFKFKEKTK